MKALLCELLFACVLAAPGARDVDELAYGNLLYAYFQEDYEGALVEGLVAESRGHQGADPARFTLAMGSLAFAEGLDRMSDNAFARLDPARLSDVDRMRLAFHRARAFYREGDLAAMSAALDTIRFEPTWFGRDPQHPEVAFMRAEAALAGGDMATAERALASLPTDAEYLGYGLFNLAVARRAAGDVAGARTTLERLADLPLASPEGQDLVQRGRLALAATTRESAAPLDAQAVLDRLPGRGHYRDQALALYGELATARGDHALAARIWLALQEGDEWHASRAAAELGLPVALEALDAPTRALAAWHGAADRFEARLASLEALSTNAATTDWSAALRETYSGPSLSHRPFAPPAIASTFGSRAWLAWLAREDVNQMLGEWRELQRVQRWLEALPTRLEALEQVKQERRRRSAAARSALATQALDAQRDELAQHVKTLELALADLADPTRRVDDALIVALADPSQRARLERLDGFAAALEALPAGTERDALAARTARLRGVIIWQVVDGRSVRVRELATELDALRNRLGEADTRLARLAHAEIELAGGVEADFQTFAGRAESLAGAVATGMNQRADALAGAFREAVEEERERITGHLLTARIAIARTTDQLAASAAPTGPES